MFENTADDLILEKLLILYTLNKIEEEVSESQLTQVILDTGVMNYFSLMVLLPKMLESKFITTSTKSGTVLYSITQSGLEVIIYFQNRIPDFFKKKIDTFLKENREELLSSQIKKQASYSMHLDSEYLVTLIIIKGRKNIMSLNISVETELEAKELCRKWNYGYLDKYPMILDILNT